MDTLGKAFEELAKLENGEFTQENNRFRAHDGELIFSSTYALSFQYREVEFAVRNEVGHQDIGNISCKLALQAERMEFEIESTSGLTLLFNRRAEALKIQNKYPPFCNFVELNRAYVYLRDYAKESRFSPTIVGKNSNGSFNIDCEYSLYFKQKDLVLVKLIDFLKSLIDFLKDHRPLY